MATPKIRTQDFLYDLPTDRIAQHPLESRHDSKLLVANPPDLSIQDRNFRELPKILPEKSLVVMNDSKVLPARLPVFKATGGAAEVFLLSPIEPSANPAIALEQGSPGKWSCLIGGKRIHEGDRLQSQDGRLQAEVLSKDRNEAIVSLSWAPPSDSLAMLLESLGRLPLPPYMKREVEKADADRYQTVYAATAGSVAAPTAGLHFSPQVLADLAQRQVRTASLTLHVGAGTFKPIESESASEHTMHRELFEVSPEFLLAVADQLTPRVDRPPLVATGTTSLRTLESLYWMGAQAAEGVESVHLDQWSAYSLLDSGLDQRVSAAQAFRALAERLKAMGRKHFTASTSLMIVPGYRFQTADLLITNFHQPASSLILLVAAWAGEHWRAIYRHALDHQYRFLSYGDSSLLGRAEFKGISGAKEYADASIPRLSCE